MGEEVERRWVIQSHDRVRDCPTYLYNLVLTNNQVMPIRATWTDNIEKAVRFRSEEVARDTAYGAWGRKFVDYAFTFEVVPEVEDAQG